MTILWATARRCTWRLLPALAVALGFACLVAWNGDATFTDIAPLAAIAWLHVQALWLGGYALVVALDEWPSFVRDRADALWLERLVLGPWRGCLAASLGVVLPVAIALAVGAAAFAWIAVDADHPARRYTSITTTPSVLPAGADEVTIPLERPTPAAGLELRAFVHHEAAQPIAAVELSIIADGDPLHPGTLVCVSSADRHRIRFEPRTIERVTIRRARGGAPLRITIPPGALRLASEAVYATPANAAIAGSTYVLPLAVALAAACALRRLVGRPTALLATLAVFVSTSVLGMAPNVRAIDACADARWWPAEATFADLWPSCATGAVLLVVGLVGRRDA